MRRHENAGRKATQSKNGQKDRIAGILIEKMGEQPDKNQKSDWQFNEQWKEDIMRRANEAEKNAGKNGGADKDRQETELTESDRELLRQPAGAVGRESPKKWDLSERAERIRIEMELDGWELERTSTESVGIQELEKDAKMEYIIRLLDDGLMGIFRRPRSKSIGKPRSES